MLRNEEKLRAKHPVGSVVGKWTIRGYVKSGKPPYCWMVKAECSDCHKTKNLRPTRLAARCGCVSAHEERLRQRCPVGTRYGRLVVQGYKKVRLDDDVLQWRLVCRCDCGATRYNVPNTLTKGVVISCGCAGIEHRKKAQPRLPPGEAAFNILLNTLKQSARQRRIPFKLGRSEARLLMEGRCHYCGKSPSSVPSLARLNGEFKRNGIDRIDSSLGYTSRNVVTACKTCNLAKHAMSVDEFDAWFKRVAKHRFGTTIS